jgi:hypothetical protein
LLRVAFAREGHLREILAFLGCSALPQVEIPASVRVIAGAAFAKCTSLATVAFADGLLEIGGFQESRLLQVVEVLGRKRAQNAFEQCGGLRRVVFPLEAT